MSHTAESGRIAALDIIRGAALAGMIVFHGAWDLNYFSFSALDPNVSEGWRLFGHGIASTFLALSGFGLVLAQRRGDRLRDALRRIAVVGLAAGGISITTAVTMPGEAILFGILHCIALGNLVALPLLRVPVPILAVLAIGAVVAPLTGLPAWPGALWWIGLSNVTPDTLDYRPLLPWLGPIFAGVIVARMLPRDRLHRAGVRTAGAGWPGRAGQWAGRHSLPIYLIHQPLMFALLFGLRAVLPMAAPSAALLPDAAMASAFLKQCRTDCVAKGADPGLCTATCHCVLTAMVQQARADPQWRRLLRADRADDLKRIAAPCLSLEMPAAAPGTGSP